MRYIVVRSGGYSTFCTVLGGAAIAIGVGAALDPATVPTGQSAWLGWLLLVAVAGFIARSWFIGVRITSTDVVRVGWVRTTEVPLSQIRAVGSANYSGIWLLNTSLFSMVVLRLQDGREVEVPELVARQDTVWAMVDQLQAALGVAPSSTRRADP